MIFNLLLIGMTKVNSVARAILTQEKKTVRKKKPPSFRRTRRLTDASELWRELSKLKKNARLRSAEPVV